MHALALIFPLLLGNPFPPEAPPFRLSGAVIAESPAPEEAQRLFDEATALVDDTRSWGRAARLFERSAELRPAEDPVRMKAFRTAGHLYVYVRDYDRAVSAFRKAAEAAAEVGAVAEAAGAYLDAAHVAARQGDDRGVRELLRKGSLLAHSPHLDGTERRRILDRIPTTAGN